MSEYIYILYVLLLFSIFQHEWPVFHQPDEMHMKYKIFLIFLWHQMIRYNIKASIVHRADILRLQLI